MQDDPPDIPNGTIQLTFAELGQRRGIGRASAERLARRRKWKRILGNDGQTRVAVPLSELTLAPDDPGDVRARRVDPVPVLRVAVETLREQLARTEARADREAVRADKAESDLRDARADTARAEQQIATVRYERDEAERGPGAACRR